MRYEDKWKDEYTDNYKKFKDEYDRDDTLKDHFTDTLAGKLIVAGAIGLAGVGLYKSGALKGVMSKAIESASTFRGVVPEVLDSVRTWTRHTADTPLRSIFRGKVKMRKALTDVNNYGRTLKDTWSDVVDLSDTVSKKIQEVRKEASAATKKTYRDSRTLKSIGQVNGVMSQVKGTAKERGNVQKTLIDDIIKSHWLTEKDAAESVKRTGYRGLTLDDVLTLGKDNEGKRVLMNKLDGPIQLDDSTLEELNKFFGGQESTKWRNGKHLLDFDDQTQKFTQIGRMQLDPNLMINEAGKVADTRVLNNSFKQFMRSAAIDFQIPLVGINPIQLLGAHKPFVYDEIRYGMLHSNTVQSVITGKSGKAGKLAEDHIFIRGNVFKIGEEGSLTKTVDSSGRAFFGRLMEIPKVDEVGHGIPKDANNLRKMTDRRIREYQDYTFRDDGIIKTLYGKAAKALDIGFQDEKPGKVNIFDPMSYGNAVNKFVQEHFKPYKSYTSIPVNDVFGTVDDDNPLYVFMNNTKKMKDVGVKEFFGQFTAGRSNPDKITFGGMNAYYLVERLNQSLATVGLGMRTENLGSLPSVFANIMMRRVLPVFIGIQAFQYLNMESEKATGTQLEDKAASTAVNLDLKWHDIKDRIGITSWAKEVAPLFQGGEQISDIPGLGFLDADSSREEREEYWKNGVDPVRKGRWWTLGNTPFTGGKIEYFQPNWYRRTISDYNWTDVKYGSREEYFANSPFPSLRYPLAPLNHFFFDKYHYEEKHYQDRPYLMTSPMFENTPFVGPILSSTVGKILKPVRRMHPEYWQGGNGAEEQHGAGNTVVVGPDGSIGGTFLSPDEASAGGEGLTVEPQRESNQYIYTTSSGNTSVVNTPFGITVRDLNAAIRKKSIRQVRGATESRGIPSIIPAPSGSGIVAEDPNNLTGVLSKQYNTFSEIAGIYGFGADTLIGGEAGGGRTVIDTPGYSMSVNRAFWDQDLGAMGGELSEIYRRFIPKRQRDVEYFNPIDNTMPTWMPGNDYFVDFQHGDPYTKVKKGEMRLPGTGYEAVYGIKDPLDLGIGSSFIGKSSEDIIKHFLQQDTIEDEDALDIVHTGTTMHEKIEKEWVKSGYAIDSEQKVEDKANNIIGWYDAKVHDEYSPTGEAIVDIKTVSAKKFAALEAPVDYNQRQVNFYLAQTGVPVGMLHYVNRDDPTQTKTFRFGYDAKMLEDSLNNVRNARKYVLDKISTGELGRGDLYDYFDRFRILADVAPYSKEFKEYNALMSRIDLTDEQKEQVRQIRQNITDRNEPLRIYPYRFKTANLDFETVTVTKVLDNDMFLTKEHPNNPIRFAGIDVLSDQSTDEGKKATKTVNTYLKPGRKIKIGRDASEMDMVSNDTYKTIRAVVYQGGNNVNKALLDRGLAKEKDEDWSPASIHARFTPGQIAFGKAWESVSHANTYFNTKFLQVRSALESYKRRDLYGKDFQTWSHPFRDYLQPSIDSMISGKFGIVAGALIGSWFGRTKYGKLVGAVTGAAVAGIGKVYKHAYQASESEAWIPERREKERNLNEYVDILKFIKNRRLFEEYANVAMKKDGFDVRQFMRDNNINGSDRKERANSLKAAKKLLKLNADKRTVRNIIEKYNPKYATPGMSADDLSKAINKEINEIANFRKAYDVPDSAMKAIEYYTASEQTMYGYDQGEPLQNILAAIPKRERQYMKYFMDAPEEDRMEILKLVPRYMRRPLESAWGIPVEDKPDLIQYFKHHQLPGADWAGWREDIDLNLVKVKLVKHEALDQAEFNIWDEDVKQAREMGPVPLPNINYKEAAPVIQRKLTDILHKIGLQDVEVNYSLADTNVDVDIDLQKDKQKEIEEYIRNYKPNV